jgi:LysR family carnitine catabolism transcriptional activator
MNLKLRQLAGFVAVARAGSFSAAAREMHMTQPAFSQQIRQLEESLGMRLFERTTRHVALTEAGERVLALVQRPLDDLRDAEAYLLEMAAVGQGRVALASLPSVASALGIGALTRFKKSHPETQIRLYEGQNHEIVDKVLARQVDFGLCTLASPDPRLNLDPLVDDELVAVCPSVHALARRRSVGWKDLAHEPLILLTPGSSVRAVAEQHMALSGSRIAPSYEVAGIVTALALVRAGLGITVRPKIAIEPLMMTGLVSIPFATPRPTRRIGVITLKGRTLAPTAQLFLKLLGEEAGRRVKPPRA